VDAVEPPSANVTTFVGNDNIAAGAMLAEAASMAPAAIAQ